MKQKDLEEQKNCNPEIYIKKLYEKREQILQRIKSIKQQKSELSQRNSRAN